MRKDHGLYFKTMSLFTSLALAGCSNTSVEPTKTEVSSESCNPSPGLTVDCAPKTVEFLSIPNARVVYYDISGSNENELRTQLNMLRPTDHSGYKADSVTNWFIKWNWPGYKTSGPCNLDAVTVSYDILIIFPRWKIPENTDPNLVARWEKYTQSLTEHEKGHVDFIVNNYLSVAQAIKGATCDTAEATAQAALIPLRQHDLDYDRETSHGKTQGARFP
ncbi:MAG TPA: DUF922 domain-containing protein [Alphaproteobacteria bacterium]|jgi:predicted secreted Zn-dependent protease|nr:DUF922 domain-containing protein [Alphaproteobacteria bacterium]